MQEWTQEPMNYANLAARIETLQQKFPWLQTGSLGRSLLGKELLTLHFPLPSRREPCPSTLLFAGAFHGMEWITSTLLLAFAQALCVRLEEGSLRLAHPVVVVPCVNPDGVGIQIHGAKAAGRFCNLVCRACGGNSGSWQANARGVDLNHNFNANWRILRRMEHQAGIHGPAPTQFGGCYPESEPETRHLVQFCQTHPVASAIAFHSQGEEIYYRFGDDLPACAEEIAQRLAQASGYTLAQPSGLASYGGFKDWFIQEFHRPAFTVEVGKGKNPLPVCEFDEIYQKVEPLCFAFLEAV